MVARDGDTLLWQESEGAARQTMLTVRVKKADVDAYAKGKLNAEDFQKRARLAAYNTGSGGGVFGVLAKLPIHSAANYHSATRPQPKI